MILLLDNYDSFVHNLARYFRILDRETTVVRSDDMTVDDCERMAPDAVVISPGPRRPHEAGCSVDVVSDGVDVVSGGVDVVSAGADVVSGGNALSVTSTVAASLSPGTSE